MSNWWYLAIVPAYLVIGGVVAYFIATPNDDLELDDTAMTVCFWPGLVLGGIILGPFVLVAWIVRKLRCCKGVSGA